MTAFRLLRFFLLLSISVAGGGSRAGDGLDTLVGPQTPLHQGDRISFIGDSITMQGGYVTRIEEAIKASETTRDLGVKVFKHGLNGATVETIVDGKTPWGKQPPFAELLSHDQPTVAVIFLGVNDVTHGTITAEQYEAGLTGLVRQAKATGAIVVLATPAVAGEKVEDSSRQRALDQYAAIARTVADTQDVTVCDLRKAFVAHLAKHNTENKSHGLLTQDGIHMRSEGNALLAEEFSRAMTTALRAARTSSPPTAQPPS